MEREIRKTYEVRRWKSSETEGSEEEGGEQKKERVRSGNRRVEKGGNGKEEKG